MLGIFSSIGGATALTISAQKSVPPQHAAVVGPADDHGPRAPVSNGAG